MEYVEISKVIDIELGKTPSRNNTDYWNGENTWITIADMTQKYIEESKEKITDIAIKNTKIKKVPQNTVIMSFKLSIGKRAITKAEVYTNEAIAAFHIKDLKSLIPEYLYYALESVDFLKYTDKAVKGKTLNKEKLKKIRIPISSLLVQLKISKILNKIQKIIENKRKQIILFDELIKSRFIEMFGDPIKNDKGWEKEKLGEVTNKISSGATPTGGKENYKTSGISLIRSMNVHNGYFEYKDLAYISNEQARQLKNVEVELEDILLNITGASIARSCLVPSNIIPARVNQHVMIIRIKNKILNSIFLNNLFLNNVYKQKLINLGEANGATRQALTKIQIEKLEIILPPLSLQNEFAEFVTKTNKLSE